jgi:hypothetical protein
LAHDWNAIGERKEKPQAYRGPIKNNANRPRGSRSRAKETETPTLPLRPIFFQRCLVVPPSCGYTHSWYIRGPQPLRYALQNWLGPTLAPDHVCPSILRTRGCAIGRTPSAKAPSASIGGSVLRLSSVSNQMRRNLAGGEDLEGWWRCHSAALVRGPDEKHAVRGPNGVHPAKIRAAESRKQKHDRRDADLILKLLLENRFPSIWLPSKELRDLRALLLHRHQWVRMRT